MLGCQESNAHKKGVEIINGVNLFLLLLARRICFDKIKNTEPSGGNLNPPGGSVHSPVELPQLFKKK